MVVSFCSSLSLRAAFFVPRTAWNPCITPLNVMADVRRWFRRLVTFSQSTSTSTIPPEVSAHPLRNQDNCLPHDLLFQSSIPERCLNDGDNLQQVGEIRCVVPSGRNQPLAELFCSHSRRVTWVVKENPAHHQGDLLVLQYGVIHWERVHPYWYWLSWRWDCNYYMEEIL